MDHLSCKDEYGSRSWAGLDALTQDYRATVGRVLADPRITPWERRTWIDGYTREYWQHYQEEIEIIGEQMRVDAQLFARSRTTSESFRKSQFREFHLPEGG